jgi:hypothetical protein
MLSRARTTYPSNSTGLPKCAGLCRGQAVDRPLKPPNLPCFSDLQILTDWFQICFEEFAAVVLRIFEGKMNAPLAPARGQRNRHSLLPLLVFLFVVSYGLLTMLVVLQDRTIDAQSNLIHLLFKENRHLAVIATAQQGSLPVARQLKRQKDRSGVPPRELPPAGPVASKSAQNQLPSTQVPLREGATQIPSSQEKTQTSAKSARNPQKTGKANRYRPPAEMTDPSDNRRTLISI